MYEHTWMAGESRPAVANVGGPVGSDLSGPSDGFKPGHKLVRLVEAPSVNFGQ